MQGKQFLLALSQTFRVCLKAMLHEAIFLATCNATMTNKNVSSCRGGVTRLQLFSQLATRTITNKMAEALSRRKLAKDEL